jgi:DNA-binding beta-propeller fold protein YncE
MPTLRYVLASVMTLAAASFAQGADGSELKVKRQDVFEFSEKPSVVRNGNSFEISFTAQSACDVTVAVESGKGEILRHLACGVLGENAPAPLKKGSLKQNLAWDGKDDLGNYIQDINEATVRVSLGLKPTFEKALYHEPKKRFSHEDSIICPTKEGVYVYDGGNAVDFVRLYDHDGNYVRTVYPFPADKIKDVNGLMWHDYPEDGKHLPIKANFLQNSLLTGGTQAFSMINYDPKENCYNTIHANGYCHYGMYGRDAMSMAVRNGRVALAHIALNRFGTDGTSGGMTLTGPQTSLQIKSEGGLDHGKEFDAAPRSLALSPDGKTLYLAGYVFSHKTAATKDIVLNTKWSCVHGVFKLNMDDDSPLKLFVGSQKPDESGTDNTHFNVPASVAVDDEGRVYVADFMNDRVQVYSAAGQFEKSIKVAKPAQISIDSAHGELIVASFLICTPLLQTSETAVPATLTRMGPLNNPVKLASYPIPMQSYIEKMHGNHFGSGIADCIAYDPYAARPTVWVSEEYPTENVINRDKISQTNIRVLEVNDKALAPKRDFMADVKQSVVRIEHARESRQRLNVNPKTGKLYVCEGQTADYKAFKQILEIDPETGKVVPVELPFDAEDMCFDHEGLAYLRTLSAVARYDMSGSDAWREVPWDYGDEFFGKEGMLATSSSSDRRQAEAQSALTLPSNGYWHTGGMFVSLKGNMVVGCKYFSPIYNKVSRDEKAGPESTAGGKAYQPAVYPGRSMMGRGGGIFIHIWDKHGKMIVDDAVPGLADNSYGLGLDSEDNVYALIAATRVYNGNKHFNDMSGSMAKFISKKTKILSSIETLPVPLPKNEQPQRPPDIANSAQGAAWVDAGTEWLYGGVGFCGKNRGVGCACFNCRFAFDYFNRSFAPELDRYSVAVIDSAGNLIVRIGQYGNSDSAGAKSLVPLGGDEVGLVHGAYVAVHTDKRLFISDPCNARIVSVRLDYHSNEVVALKTVADQGRK